MGDANKPERPYSRELAAFCKHTLAAAEEIRFRRRVWEEAQPSLIYRHRVTGTLFDWGKLRIIGFGARACDRPQTMSDPVTS